MLDRGRRVELAADILDGLGDFEGGAALGALEGHMLEQVGNAVLGLALGARARLDPNAQRSAFQMRHVIGEHHHAVFQTRRSYAHTGPPEPAASTTAALRVVQARLCAAMKSSIRRWSFSSTLTRSGRW